MKAKRQFGLHGYPFPKDAKGQLALLELDRLGFKRAEKQRMQIFACPSSPRARVLRTSRTSEVAAAFASARRGDWAKFSSLGDESNGHALRTSGFPECGPYASDPGRGFVPDSSEQNANHVAI